MTAQLSLFDAPRVPVINPPKAEEPVESSTLESIGHLFVVARRAKEANACPAQCRECRCTEASPCRLREGEHCTINSVTGFCSKPSCVLASIRLKPVAVRGGRRAAAR